MILELLDAGYEINSGADLYFDGDLPNGAGLSSSASIELLTGAMINALFGLNIEMLDLVKFGQKTENNYVGVDSGIMDQFAVGMGRDNQAILLDTNTLDYAYADIDLGDNVIVIMNTNKKESLKIPNIMNAVKNAKVLWKILRQFWISKHLGIYLLNYLMNMIS